MMNMSHTLINVIDVWDTTQMPWPNRSDQTIKDIQTDMCEFSKFLSIKLESFKKQGAHINIAMHYYSPNPHFTFHKHHDVTYIEQSDELKQYMDNNNLTQLILCGAHLFKCISARATGYHSMKTIVPNTKVAITLCRPLPQDAFEPLDYPVDDLVYL